MCRITKFSLFILATCTSLLARADTVEIKFSVHTTQQIPIKESLYVAGNVKELGSWNPKGLVLSRKTDQEFEAVVQVPAGEVLEFKITKGSWQAVEKSTGGLDIKNRTAVAKSELVIEATVESFGSEATTPASTVLGTVQMHRLGSIIPPRTVRVWLPPDYGSSTTSYPVLYMLDGQNVFDSATSAVGQEWGVDETLTKLTSDGKIAPMIVAAIDNSNKRIAEYTPFEHLEKGQRIGGQADEFARWIVKELKPKIDAEYRTVPDRHSTWIAGSSLGGLLALYLTIEHNETFGGAIAMSPSLFWGDERTLELFSGDRSKWNKPTSIWVDFGDKESADAVRAREHVERYVRLKQKLDALALRSKANSEIRVGGRVFAGAAHNETAWRNRFGEAIQFIVSSRP